MNHAEHDESIGSMLASIAAALREVSDKLDIVAARVQLDVPTFPADEDVPDPIRIRRLESWAFRASQDISRLSSRLDALDNGGETESGPARGTRSRREVREAAEAAERAVDGLGDQLPAAEPLPAHQNRDADSPRPPLERRSSPARPATDHLGDPTALAATPIARTVQADTTAARRLSTFESDSFATVDSDEPLSRRAPARLGTTAGPAPVGGTSLGDTATPPNGIAATNGSANGVARDIAAARNGAPVSSAIGTVLTAVDHTPASADRTSTTGGEGGTVAAPSAHGPEVSAGGGVPLGDVNGSGPGTGAMQRVSDSPTDAQSTVAASPDPLTTPGFSAEAVIERARPARKPTETATATGRLSAPSPDAQSSNGNGVARPAPADAAHTANDHGSAAFIGEQSAPAPNGKQVNGFNAHTANIAPAGGEHTPVELPRPAVPVDEQHTANGIHWSFSEDPAPTSPAPDRNGHARNGFTTDSARRSDSLFDDFTPRDRLSTGETPDLPAVPGPPARLTPPAELTTPPTDIPAQVNGSSDGPAHPSLSGAERPANNGRLPDLNTLTGHAPLTDNAGRTSHQRPADFDPPTLGLPTGRETPAAPDPERPVADPIPPTATDAAGITVTGTYRAFDIERAHVDKLQAMLDELKRSAGLPPGRRDVFGPPTPDLGQA